MSTIIKTAVQQQWDIDYIDQAGHRLAKDIDFEVLASMLVSSCGWTTVELPSLRSNDNAIDIADWLNLECKAHWRHRGRTFVFESKDEAALFKLTWS
jgi:hypothetical protein